MQQLFLFLATFVVPIVALSHGGDKPGPHGGFVTMPGPFHVELVQKNERTLQIFLLDMNFKNPQVAQSKVEATVRSSKTQIALKCRPQETHFICESSQKIPGDAEVIVQSTRENAVGNKAIYQFPLRHSTPAHH